MMQKITVSYHPYDEDLALLTQKDAHNIFSRHKFITGPQEWSWSTMCTMYGNPWVLGV